MALLLPQGFRAHVANIGIKDQTDDFTLVVADTVCSCLLYTSPSPRDGLLSRMPSSA